MSKLIAITGKGGTGKTTVSACLVRMLLERGVRPILAVDADPNSTLPPLLGLSVQNTISDIRKDMMESKAKITGVPKERVLEMKLEECLMEAGGFDLLTMGRPEGADCYCYVNNLLRGALARLRGNYRVTLVDNEAGMEHLSRMNTNSIDCLLLVCEPTLVSARSAARIFQLAEKLPVEVRRRVLVWNKVPPGGVPDCVLEMLSGESFHATVCLPTDERIARLAIREESALDGPALPSEFEGLLDACEIDSKALV